MEKKLEKELYDVTGDINSLNEFFYETNHLNRYLPTGTIKEFSDSHYYSIEKKLYDLGELTYVVIEEIIRKDPYFKLKNIKKIEKKDLNSRLTSHLINVEHFLSNFSVIERYLSSAYEMTVSDLIFAYDTFILNYYSLIFQMVQDDYELLNKGNYTDEVLKIEIDNIKKEADLSTYSLEGRVNKQRRS